MHELDVIWRLGLALLLSSAIGVEREIAQKAAGLRTYTLVGVGSAVFMLVSTYGFADVLGQAHTALDPSRVAAQIVSGIGFIGGGIIFVRGFSISDLSIKHDTNGAGNGRGRPHVTVELEVRGQGSLAELATELHELDGVIDVRAGDTSEVGY